MAEQYSTLPETHERPPLPRSAWSLESLELYNTKPTKQRKPARRNDLNLEKCRTSYSYQSRRSRILISMHPTSQYHLEQPHTKRDRKSRHTYQHSSNQDAMQDKYVLPASSRDRTRVQESPEIKLRCHRSSSGRSRSKNKTTSSTHSNRRPRPHERGSRGSHSDRRRSKRKHRNQQILAPSYTILQWLLWKLSCGG
jgi:hypothetical protein